jgi:hypothetical protein
LNDLAVAIDLLPWRTEAGARNEHVPKELQKHSGQESHYSGEDIL